MFYELYGDVDITSGGLWWDPDEMEYVEVVDLARAGGVDGTNLILRGSAFMDEKVIRKALPVIGEERRESDAIQAFRRFVDVDKFKSLSRKDQNALYVAALAVFSYMGIDGPPEKSTLVIDASYPSAQSAEALAEEWRADEWIVTADPKKAIKKIVKDMGVGQRRR